MRALHGSLNTKRLSTCMLCAAMLLSVFLQGSSRAAETGDEKVVRVGYVNAINYEEGGEGEYKRGAGYEYLQKISYITGWKYEYVYGSFTECYDMLARGEIDLFGNVSYTEQRAEEIDYSAYPQGKDTYWIYTSKLRPDLASGDIRRLEGCRIGVTAGSFQAGLLSEWLDSNHIQAQVVGYGGYNQLMDALGSSEVDAIVAPDLSVSYDCLAVVSIGASDYYFAVSKSRPDILSELNMALYEIQSSETDYNSRLFSRYYYKTASGLAFNEEEKAWLSEHGNTIRLGYFADDLPFAGQENGELAGVVAVVMDALEREYGITVEAEPYDGLAQMKAALIAHEIDIAGPVVSDFYLTEQDGLVLSDSIVDMTPVVIYKGEDYNSCLNVIAVSDSCMFGPGIVSVLFPDAELYLCESQEECLRAVSEGIAGSTVIPSSRINILNADPLMKDLSFAEMAKRTDVGLLAARDGRRAASIVNKGIEQSSELLSGVVLAQHSAAEEDVSLSGFVSAHVGLIVTLAAAIIFVLGLLIYRLYVSRRQLVAALEDAKNANTANIAKTTFLNNMSHDIRTPMNAVIGFTNIAFKHEPKDEIRGCLEKIKQSSEYLLALINDVLDISRIESGNIKYDPIPVDINAVTDSVLNIARGFLIDRDLELRVVKTPTRHPYVLADEIRIREILINIISNAIKFTNDGGRITFEFGCHPGKDLRHTIAVYRITDTGIGMDEEFRKKIFDEFAQENSGARTQYKGTGLGMTIAKRYVELMGGSISVESKKGVGSAFTVQIPLELTDLVVDSGIAPVIERDLTGVRVLLAEDNDLNAEIACMLLEDHGMKVTRADDGKKALELFTSDPPGTYDIILMDIMMPRMNGYEATRAIRHMDERPDGRDIPIVAMTANAFAEDVKEALDSGMNAHLSKPIVMDQVIRVISENLSRAEHGKDAAADAADQKGGVKNDGRNV